MNFINGTKPRSLSRWHGREIEKRSGAWAELRDTVPTHAMVPFAVGDDPDGNPHLRAVVCLSGLGSNRAIPVGVVSPAYSLAQHRDLGDLCVDSLRQLDLFYDRLRCDLEITEFGEWMHLRLHLGDEFSLVPSDGHALDLCVDLYNSVDGSSRLMLAMSWFRLVCNNGLIVRGTEVGLADKHDRHLDTGAIGGAIRRGIARARADERVLRQWWETRVTVPALERWADGPLAAKWGKTAAARCLLICREGMDGKPTPFEQALPSERSFYETARVPGAIVPAQTSYAVAQALSWIAGTRPDVDERTAWLSDIPLLLRKLKP